MDKPSQRGSAIFLLLVAVGLFAALAYVFMQGSRTSTSMLTAEATKATATQAQQCSNAVNSAVKRLQLRGCGNTISYLPDGSNLNAGAPTDGSCSIYHINGGGVAPCTLSAGSDSCTTGAIGTVCTSDGTVYAGTVAGNRIYFEAVNSSNAILWKTAGTTTVNTTSDTNGVANTDAMITAGAALHPAGQLCRAKGANWYVPAKDELALLYTNRAQLAAANVPSSGSYWSSTEWTGGAGNGWFHVFSTGVQSVGAKSANSFNLRCVHR